MTQMDFSDAEYADKRKQARREKFLADMEHVLPWNALLALIEPVYPKAGKGRRPHPIKMMLRIHLCRIGSVTAIRRWKKRCMKWRRCVVSQDCP